MNLSTSIEEIPRVGPQYQKRLKRLGIKTVGELFFHFPFRYEDFSNITPISLIEIGKTVCIQGKIMDIKNIRIFRKRMVITQASANDDSGTIRIAWFNQPYLINTLKKGDFVFLTGKMTSKNGKKYLSSPAYEKIPPQFIENGTKYDSVHAGRIIPVYPETEGMSSRWLRFIIKPLLAKLKNGIIESLPEEIKRKYNLMSIKEAVWQIHFPDALEKASLARKRFVFEELFELALLILREKIKLAGEKATAIHINLELIKEFTSNLSFKLTDDQKKSAWQILKDLEKPRPMNRLLDGDVGSGKTVVATIAALNTTNSGLQVAIMAPTEILAKQHSKTIKEMLKSFKLNIGLITGKENIFQGKKIKRNELLKKTKSGKINILIGTHALIREKVEFKNLGLVIIDEQHRFGIEQRAKLCKKQSFLPHLLSMSATPIPRTLALTIYGDLDLSLIKEVPKGRKKIITKIIPPEKRKEAYDFIRQEVKKERQIFVICPRIETPENYKTNSKPEPQRRVESKKISSSPPSLPLRESSVKNECSLNGKEITKNEMAAAWAEVKAVKKEYEKLSKEIFPDLSIGMLHGRMKVNEKEKILKSFKDKKIDILVSTSVIEVGIDFPNATIMMIEDSEKFGLAQLHQFRGRVGRGKHQSFCFLFSQLKSNSRLKAMVASQDGFELAEKDLRLRGPGNLTGQRQWGIPDFVMASLKDIELVEKTRQAAKEILQEDLDLKKYPALRDKIEHFQKRIHLE